MNLSALGNIRRTGIAGVDVLRPSKSSGIRMENGAEAGAEFQKFLDHRGIVINFPLGALAHLQLGRALAMTGNGAGARKQYQDFFALWRDADPDIPVLQQARTEYARLK